MANKPAMHHTPNCQTYSISMAAELLGMHGTDLNTALKEGKHAELRAFPIPTLNTDAKRLGRHVVTKFSVLTAGGYDEIVNQATALNYGDEITLAIVDDLLGISNLVYTANLLADRNVPRLYDGGPLVGSYATSNITALLGHELMKWPPMPATKYLTGSAVRKTQADNIDAELAAQRESLADLQRAAPGILSRLGSLERQLADLSAEIAKHDVRVSNLETANIVRARAITELEGKYNQLTDRLGDHLTRHQQPR